MALFYCGIDEAGYGPLLGPLCVGMTAFRIEGWEEGRPAPDLWSSLSSAVCRKPERGARAMSALGRIAVDDSKNLKLANSSKTRDPLVHLERGVLTFMRCRAGGTSKGTVEPVSDDAALFRALGLVGAPAVWYGGEPSPCPRACDAGVLGISASMLERTLAGAGVTVEDMACRAIGEREFNRIVEVTGTKAATTERAIGEHLATIWKRWAGAEEHAVRVVCDRQGGRTQYGASLARMMNDAGAPVVAETLEEGPERSRYELRGKWSDGSASRDGRMVVMFMSESETHHLPVALASMTAKLVREMFMARFNRFWAARVPELKPTAGYRQDGWRWLEDLGPAASDDERAAMIRRA
ncbi:MAG: hypothetical protein KF768_13075 [Phycisphaeraceae bacterium]|nr:hypothetical protein [Phycisphaeraceae bacterium]